MGNRRPPSPYKETINIEKSRPSSPVTKEERNVPVSIGQAVRNYLESGKEPQIRERSARSRRGSEAGTEEKENAVKTDKTMVPKMEAKEPVIKSKTEVSKTTIDKQSKPVASSLNEKSKDLPSNNKKVEEKPNYTGLNLVNRDGKLREVKEPTDEEREARRQMVSSLFQKRDVPTQGKLELEGIGKEGDEGESLSEGLVTRTSPTNADKSKKNDLSDLAALVAKKKTASKTKEKVGLKKCCMCK